MSITFPNRPKRMALMLEFLQSNDVALIVIATLIWLSAVGAIVGISWMNLRH